MSLGRRVGLGLGRQRGWRAEVGGLGSGWVGVGGIGVS